MAYVDYYKELKSGKLQGIYLLYGPEKYIMDSMIDQTIRQVIEPGFENLDVFKLEGKGLDFNSAFDSISHLPFASKKRLIIVRNPDFIDSEKWKPDQLELYLKKHGEYEHILSVLTCDGIDKRKSGTKLFSKYGKIIEFSRINREELFVWIQQEFTKLNKKIDSKAINFIADNHSYLDKNSEKDLASLHSLIEVIADSSKSENISLSETSKFLQNKYESNVFKWRNATLMGSYKDSISYLYALIESGEHPNKLMYMLEAHLRDLHHYILLKSASLSDNKIAEKMGKRAFMLNDYKNMAKLPVGKKLNYSFDLLLKSDDLIKIGSQSGEMVLQKLAYEFHRMNNSKSC